LLNRGYLTIEARTAGLETHGVCANDYAIALFARGLGKDDDYRKYSIGGKLVQPVDMQATDQGSRVSSGAHRDGSWKANFDPLLSGTWVATIL